MSAHTPGPWLVYVDCQPIGDAKGFVPVGGCGCCGSPWVNGENNERQVANARLISAAPDLLEVLSDLFENPLFQTSVGGNPIRIEDLMKRARNALAKARGQEPITSREGLPSGVVL
jgi:hypothetical protein